jgi:cephalosporin-C deacetylase-like acetyl esterase
MEAFKISLANVDGTRVWAFLTMPKVVTTPLPLLVSVPGASFRAPARPGLDWVDRGVMRLWISVHPHDPQLSTTELDALEASPAGRYTRLGAPDPDRYYYRRAILGADRMIDYVCANFPWDGEHCVVYGQSQGGAFSLFAAALNGHVTACVAEAPAMCDHGGVMVGRGAGWPYLVPGGDQPDQQRLLLAMSGYFDGVFFARRIRVPTLFTVGFVDDTCPPTSVYAAFNQVAGPKSIVHQVDRGHALGSPEYRALRDGAWLPEALGLLAAASGGGGGPTESDEPTWIDETLWVDEPLGGDGVPWVDETSASPSAVADPVAVAAAWAILGEAPPAAPLARVVSEVAAVGVPAAGGVIPGIVEPGPAVFATGLLPTPRRAIAWREAARRRASERPVPVAGLGGDLFEPR